MSWRGSDLDFRNSLVRVTAKPLWGFGPKNCEERAVPLPTALWSSCKNSENAETGYLHNRYFPIPKGIPTVKMTIVKRVA